MWLPPLLCGVISGLFTYSRVLLRSSLFRGMCEKWRRGVWDCREEVKIFRALILGELERGQNQYQALCFISRLSRNEIIPRVDGSIFEVFAQTTEAPSFQACHSTKDLWQPCLCTFGLRLEWYPCLLKYCRSRDGTAKGTTYKCGIRSCSKGYHFTYYVPQKQLCLWDEET
ncbi:hypothetical protein XENOCAPTIV_008162 [Xenoophorus captivus]|uniref:Out at first protein homolog n=1 Tax=Xenoophorus captivus TaxID=1517983 RepID=A0ABV0QV06_9TELE